MSPRHLNEIKGIVIFAVGILVFLGLISYTARDISFLSYPVNFPAKNLIRVSGAWLSFGLFFLIGWVSFVLPLMLFSWGIAKFRDRVFFDPFRIPGFILLTISLSALMGISSAQEAISFERGGLLGFACAQFLVSYFGSTGSWVIALSLALLSCVLVMEFLVSHFVLNLIEIIKAKVKFPRFQFNFPNSFGNRKPNYGLAAKDKKTLPLSRN